MMEVALVKAEGMAFERYCHAFFSLALGDGFLPLGGMHDGGADGVILRNTTQVEDSPTHFFQASIEQDTSSKIRKTVRALRSNGRDPQQLTYATTQRVPLLDKVEAGFRTSVECSVTIRDRDFFMGHANDSPATQAAFWEFLGVYVEAISRLGSSPLPTQSKFMDDPTIFVFLRQESDREEDEPFADSVADALSLWALQGTDPDKGILLSAKEIRGKVLEVVPSVAHLLSLERVQARLQLLSAKDASGRKVRWHRKDNLFALPYETRITLSEANASDEALRLRVSEALTRRARLQCSPALDPERVGAAALIALQRSFESRGLQFASFLESGDTAASLPNLDQPAQQAVDEVNPGPAVREDFYIATLATVRDCLYHGSEDEREYLRRLGRTYAMLFVLRQDPKVVEYLSEMTARFTLYVGTDVLVQAMSERYLPEVNRSASNLLRMAQVSGATLILTEPVLEEVVTHLRAADWDFRNHYATVERHLPTELYGEISKIMIRAYFYNRDLPGGPQRWEDFLDQFCDYRDLHRNSAEEDLRNYVQAKYGMAYESREAMEAMVDAGEVASLSLDLLTDKNDNSDLAMNDALMAHAVYGRRVREGEDAGASVFGYGIWWLTSETRILKRTGDLVRRHGGSRYMMRPDFLLNFFALAPSMAQVRQTYRRLFPTTLGLELSRRMDRGSVAEILAELKVAEGYDEARRLSVMSKCADRIKSDFKRRHLQVLSGLDAIIV